MKDDTFSIYYPSGNFLEVFARYIGHKRDGDDWHLCLMMLENKIFNEQLFSINTIMVLDPRSVVVDSSKTVVYTPREHLSKINAHFQQWLDSNRDWPDRLELPA